MTDFHAHLLQVVGLCKLPLDGNPNKAMGLIAHPGEVGHGLSREVQEALHDNPRHSHLLQVTSIAVTYDSEYLITAGGSDQTVHVWKIHTEVIDATEVVVCRAVFASRAIFNSRTLG